MQSHAKEQAESCNTKYCLMDQMYHFRDRDVRIPAIEAHVLIDSGKVIISSEEQERIRALLLKAIRNS